MVKPKATQANGKKSGGTSNPKIFKKKQKAHGPGTLRQRLRSDVENPPTEASPTPSAIAKKVKQKIGKKTSVPGQFVLAPPPLTDASESNSNSEDESYIDRFFHDVLVPEDNGNGNMSSSTDSESEPSEEDGDESMDEEEDELLEEDEENTEGGSEGEEEESSDDQSEASSDDQFGAFQDVFDLINGVNDNDFSMSELSASHGLIMAGDPDSDSQSDCSFNYEDCEEISLESYSDDPETSEESDPDEFVEGNCRFVDVKNGNISFPSEGASIVEIDNNDDDDDEECPELVPIPKSFLETPPPKADKKPTESSRSRQDMEVADLDCYFSQDFSEVLIHMKETFYFHGSLSIKVIAGSVNILQHVRTHESSSQEITAVATLDDYPVELSINQYEVKSIARCLGEMGQNRFHYNQLMHIKNSYENHQAVILLKSLDLNHLKLMQSHMSKKLLPEGFRNHFESVLKCRFYRDPQQIFQTVNLAAAQPTDDRIPRIITVGGKNTGKSTFNKCLGNSILSEAYPRFVYIDLDIGQPEFGVPQTVSAHVVDSPTVGRGFMKCDKTDLRYSLVYGHLNVALDPVRYLSCIDMLFAHLDEQEDLPSLPWIVNTMGYVRGIGLDIMHVIISKMRPTKVLQFRHPIHHLENFPLRLDPTFMAQHESSLVDIKGVQLDYDWQWGPSYISSPADDVRQLKGTEARQMNIVCHLGLALNRNFVTSFNEVEPIW